MAPPPEPPPILLGGWQQVQQRVAEPPPPQKRPEADTEYAIGAKLLPKLGALLVLGAVLYFVSWAYSAGWITKQMIFAGEIAFCIAFIAVGQWKRNEREEFGQILTGIGSCGLYASFAGGHLVQNLFSGEWLVTLFMTLSLANLAYGLWCQSKSFFAIGLLGGFAGALLPMQESKTTLNAILHLSIVAPAALIAARRRWADMAGALWFAGTLALIPLLSANVDWQIRIITLYAASLASVAAYLYSAREKASDPQELLAPVMLFVTALIGLAVEHDRAGALHLGALAVGAVLAAMVAGATPIRRNAVFVTAIAIPATLAPVCFTRIECLWIYSGLAIVASMVAVFGKLRLAGAFSGVEFVLAILGYLAVESWNPIPLSQEAWLLGGVMAAGIVTAVASVRVGGLAEPFTMAAMAVILPLFARFGVVTLTGTSMSATPEFAAAEAVTFFALAAILVTARTRWISAMVAMWASFTIAIGSYVYAVSFGTVPSLHDALLVGVLAVIVAVGAPVATGTAPPDFRKAISGSAGIVVGLILMRLSFVVASMPHAGYDPGLAMCLTAAGYSIAASLFAFARESDPATATGWAMFVASGAGYVLYPGGLLKPPAEMMIVSGLLSAYVAASAAVRRAAVKEPELWHLVALAGWVVFSRWVDVALTWNGIDLHGASSLTVAWIVYALALLCLGFAMKARELRYWSFGVMFVTISKILLIDLAYTSTPFRVGVLLGLGLLMLGGGYWYIKGRHTPVAG